MSEKKNKALKPGRRLVKFGDVVRLSKARSQDPQADGIERYVGLEHLEPGDLRIRSWGNVADGVTFTSVFQPGQVLFGKRRAYQRKVAVADFSGVCSGDIYVLETKDANVLLPELLPFICRTDAFFDHAVGTSAGSLSPRTNWTSLADFELELPPIREQLAIVSTLLQAVEVNERLRHAKSAGCTLFERLVLDTFAPRRENYHDSNPLSVFPANWSVSTMEELCQSDAPICYGIVQVGDNDPVGIPTVQIKDLSGGFFGPLHKTSKHIERGYERSRIEPGDVLISVKAIIGEVACVPPRFSGNISRDIARIRPGPNIESSFLLMLLRSAPYRRYIQKYIVGSTRDELSIGTLKKLRVPYPDIKEQKSIVATLEAAKLASTQFEQRSECAQKLVSAFLQEAL
ncbi:restriction endonuclease subunit S [Burkholderia pseudomallei]|uniref:restriction endonuclease subunit S n=1 Tax=Burkholderia pseudomallei TaxID=28450 RepID=UPI000536D641|nr:restriction endonuclease subunit S [Burkholderia pseudomallei]KGW28536.1 type I restriction modification DNA specificity domain protein [Burkholderia pseudomallei MSHR733]KGW89630.1 type I restriction modification DNA specificity domain protein [Burkholderia pseudomallei MSHR332]